MGTVLRCCDCCEVESCQSRTKIESWRREKRTVKRTNVTCDHINKWSKRKLVNITDEMSWVVLTRSRSMRVVVVILEWSVSCPLLRPDARQHSFWGMWCILVCHPHLTIIPCCTAVWAQACGLDHKTSFVTSLHLGSFGVRNCFYLVVGLSVGQCHDTATSGTYYSDLRNCDNSCSGCVGIHVTISRHCQFFVHDSETEDPQLVAESWRVGRNHGKTMGKN